MIFKMNMALIKKYRKLLLSILIVSALGCAIIIGLSGSYVSLEKSLNKYVSDYKYPDGIITTEVTNKDIVADMEGIPGVKRVVARLCADTIMVSPSGRYLSIRAFSYRDDDFEKFHFWSTAAGSEYDEILIEVGFAEDNGIKVGDIVSCKIGEEFREYFVAGLISIPETLAAQPTDDSWGANADFGFVYAKEELLQKEVNEDHENASEELEQKKEELTETEDDAQKELDEAKKELDEAKSKLEEEKQNFEDTKVQLKETLDELESTKKQLEGTKDELEQKKLDILTKQEEGINKQIELNETRKNLLDKKEELLIQKQTLEEKKAEVASKKSELNSQKDGLITQKNELSGQLNTLNQQKSELEESIRLLNSAKDGLAEIDSALAEIDKSYAKLTDGGIVSSMSLVRGLPASLNISDLSEIKAQLSRYVQFLGYNVVIPVPADIAGLKSLTDMIVNDRTYLNSNDTLKLVNSIRAGTTGIVGTEAYNELSSVLGRYYSDVNESNIYRAYVNSVSKNFTVISVINSGDIVNKLNYISGDAEKMSPDEFYDAVDELLQMVSEMEKLTGTKMSTIGDLISSYDSNLGNAQNSRNELKTKRADIVKQLSEKGIEESKITSVLKEANDNLSKINTGIPQINAGISRIDDGLRQIEDGFSQIREGEEEIAKLEGELNDGFAQIDDGLSQAEDGLSEIASALSEADDALKEIEDGSKTINENVDEIDDNMAQIHDKTTEGEKEISEAEQKISENENTFNETWMDSRTQFADAWDEIAKAAEELDEFQGYDWLCNQLLFEFEEGADPFETISKAESMLGEIKLKSSSIYENSAVKNRIDINLQPIKEMSDFMPLIFFVITLVVVFLFMSLMIKQCRREIGILRAMGFTVNEIRLMYCILNFFVSIGAILVGTGIGTAVMHYVGNYYKNFFPLPFFSYHIEAKTVIFASAFTIITGQLATLISTSVIGKILPSEAMSRPAPASSKMPHIIQVLTKMTKPIVKFNIASLLRNKLRFVFSVICISASVMMIFSSFAFISSKNYILKELFDSRIHYDCQIYFSKQPDEELMKELNSQGYVSEVYDMYYYDTEILFNGKSEETAINALAPECALVGIYDENGKQISIPNDGIVLEKHTAQNLGVKMGDSVVINGKVFQVAAISEQSVNRIQYISYSQAQTLGEGKFGCVICKIDKEDEQKLIAFLTEKDDYVLTVFTRVLYEGNEKIFATYDIAAWIIIGFALVLGLIIVVNTAQTNLLEQKKELCILRTLGFGHGELSRNWFVQSLLQYLFSCVIGLAAGVKIAKIALLKLSTESREYVYANGIKEYLVTAVLVFGFILLCHVIAMRSLRTWDITESVKEKE